MSDITLTTCPSGNNGSTSVINGLQLSGFQFKIAKFPELVFFVKSVSIPSLNLPEATQSTPFKNLQKPTEKVTYGDLSVKFQVDEEMKNYRTLYEWITELGFDKNYQQINQLRQRNGDSSLISIDSDLYTQSDATLLIKGQNGATASVLIFKNIWPTDIGSLELTDDQTETQYVYCDVTFKFSKFKFEDETDY